MNAARYTEASQKINHRQDDQRSLFRTARRFLYFCKGIHSMNKSYKSVWNESTGTWVAVSELATGRSKSKRAKKALSTAILTQIAVGGISLAGAGAAMADEASAQDNASTVVIADNVADAANAADAGVINAPSQPMKLGSSQMLGATLNDTYIAIGTPGVRATGNASAFDVDSIAIGGNSSASADSIAIGALSSAGTNNGTKSLSGYATAIGYAASATGFNSTVLGVGATATADDAVVSSAPVN